MSEQLKQCPLCMYERAFVNRGQLYFWGECVRCGAQSSAQTNEDKAAAAWNTRPLEDRLARQNKALVGLLVESQVSIGGDWRQRRDELLAQIKKENA